MKLTLYMAGVLLAATMAFAQTPAPATRPAFNDPAPTIVTLHDKNIPGAQVMKDFFEQAGVAYTLNGAGAQAPERWPAISVDIDKEPFWAALQKLEEAVPATINASAAGAFTVNHRAANAQRAGVVSCVSGPLLLIARDVRQSVTLTDPEQSRECIVLMQMRIEPRLKFSKFVYRAAPEIAVDENRKSLINNPPAPQSRRADRSNLQSLEILLQPPANCGRRIARLKGSVKATTFGEFKSLDVGPEQFAAPAAVDVAGATLTVDPLISKQPGSATQFPVTVTLTRNGLTDDAWSKLVTLFDNVDVSVTGADGVAWDANNNGVRQTTTTRAATFIFMQPTPASARPTTGPRATAPAIGHVVVRVPLALREVEFPYEFKDLPLP